MARLATIKHFRSSSKGRSRHVPEWHQEDVKKAITPVSILNAHIYSMCSREINLLSSKKVFLGRGKKSYCYQINKYMYTCI